MSIDKHFEKSGVRLSDDNTLPPGERTCRAMKRLIAAVRAAESEFNDEIRDTNERCRVSQAQVITLQDENRHLEGELRRFRVSEKLTECESLTSSDRTKLLEVA